MTKKSFLNFKRRGIILKKIICLSLSCLVLLIALTACTRGQDRVDTTTTTQVRTTLQPKIALAELISQNKTINSVGKIVGYQTVDYTSENCFVIVTYEDHWSSGIFNVSFDDYEIKDAFEFNDIAGRVVSHKVVTASQGQFLQLNVASDSGDGNTVLINCNTLVVDFEFQNTVDFHNEDSVDKSVVKEYNLDILEGLKKGEGYSFVYSGDYLNTIYEDVNFDGHTDIIFYGHRDLVSTKSLVPIISEKVQRNFIYNPKKKNFTKKDKIDYQMPTTTSANNTTN